LNYYSHHIGDYLSATAHLSLLEHGIYRRLIDVYYIHEAPLPSDPKQVCRLIGARTKDERDAVDSILVEFFEESTEGWKQARCDREIAITNKNRRNGKGGGRPPKNDNPDETQTEPKEKPNDNPDETQTETPHHPSPVTRHQTLKAESTPLPAKPARFDPASIPIPEGIPAAKWAEWVDYRRGRRLTTAEPTMRKQLEFLAQCQARGQPPGEVIDASIANGWQGLFELKGNGNGKNGSSRADRVSATIAELTGANRDSARTFDGSAARVD
jgi:uncharacterized protein YdaU (DUF1376 family)